MFLFLQVQEKKVKKVSVMNTDPSRVVGNGDIASSSVSSIPKQHLENGNYPDKSYNCLSNNISLPTDTRSALRLPVVVVLTLIILSCTCISGNVQLRVVYFTIFIFDPCKLFGTYCMHLLGAFL